MTEQKLKEILIDLKKSDWNIKEDIFEIAKESLENIGSTDPVLRDELILEFLFNLIVEKKLKKEEIKFILKKCLSKDFLFHKIDEKIGDGVFKRSFTVLIIRAIVYYQNEIDSSLLSKEEILDIYEKSVKYFKLEEDKRGYAQEKGWADSHSHIGDLLRTIALNPEITENQLLDILYLIREKISIDDYVFINEESERLTTAVLYVLERNKIKKEKVIKWIESFENLEPPKNYPKTHYFKENIKNFLRSLYFRLKFKNHNIYLENIEKALNHHNTFFNNLDY
ncbi:MAG: DUF2785 domain-containing protein [Thermotogota bacterium]